MQILLPVCQADDSKLIVDFVRNHHWPPQAIFKVIHVLDDRDTDTQLVTDQRSARRLLDSVIDRLKVTFPMAQIKWEVVPGSAVNEIVRTASQWNADMIIMGSRTRTYIDSVLIGSVSRDVVMQAPCSVVIIKAPHSPAEDVAEHSFADSAVG